MSITRYCQVVSTVRVWPFWGVTSGRAIVTAPPTTLAFVRMVLPASLTVALADVALAGRPSDDWLSGSRPYRTCSSLRCVWPRRSWLKLPHPSAAVKNDADNPQPSEKQRLTDDGESCWWTHWRKRLQDSPELADVVREWPELPEAIRAGIVAMVKAVAE